MKLRRFQNSYRKLLQQQTTDNNHETILLQLTLSYK